MTLQNRMIENQVYIKIIILISHNTKQKSVCRRPCLICRFVHIPVTGSFIFYTKKHSIMTPSQFVTQCVTILECQIEQSHITKITFVKAFSKLCCKFFRKTFKNSFSVFSTFVTILFIFYN